MCFLAKIIVRGGLECGMRNGWIVKTQGRHKSVMTSYDRRQQALKGETRALDVGIIQVGLYTSFFLSLYLLDTRPDANVLAPSKDILQYADSLYI